MNRVISKLGFRKERDTSVDAYAARRYGSLFQGMVDRREQRIARDLLTDCRHRGARRLVDIPCGYGRFYPLYKALGYEVASLDRSPKMLDGLERHQRLAPADRERVQRADICRPLPLDERMDLAVSIRMFQHIPSRASRRDALSALSEASGGQVLLTYYDRRCLHYWTKLLLMRLKGRRMRINMLSRRTIGEDLASSGLRVARRRRLMPGIHAQTWLLLEPLGGAARKLQALLASWLGGATYHAAEPMLVLL